MMNAVLAHFFQGLTVATLIWTILVGVSLLAVPVLIGRRKDAAVDAAALRRAVMLKRVRLSNRAKEMDSAHLELEIAAERAEAVARERRQVWLASLSDLELAWTEFDASDRKARELAAAARLPLPSTDRTPAEYAARERFLHHAAMMACTRRELSALDLSDALAHRDGWDPRLHPYLQEVRLQQCARAGRLADYRVAQGRERANWEAAEIASTAARCLRDEAHLASERAKEAWQLAIPTQARRQAPSYRHLVGSALRRVSAG